MSTINLPPGLIRKAQWTPYFNVSDNALSAMIRDGLFPPPHPSSKLRLRRWLSSDIEKFLRGEWKTEAAQ